MIDPAFRKKKKQRAFRNGEEQWHATWVSSFISQRQTLSLRSPLPHVHIYNHILYRVLRWYCNMAIIRLEQPGFGQRRLAYGLHAALVLHQRKKRHLRPVGCQLAKSHQPNPLWQVSDHGPSDPPSTILFPASNNVA